MGHMSSVDDVAVRWPSRLIRHRRAIVLMVLAALAALATKVFPESASDIGGVTMLVIYLTGGTLVLTKARHKTGRDRRAWSLIGVGLMSAGLGVLVVAVLQSMAVPVPAFGPIDLFFLGAYSSILAGTVSLPNAFRGQRDVIRTLIDGIVGAISFGTLLWIFVIEDVVSYFAEATSWDRWVGTAYPLLDVLTIVVFVTILGRRSQYRLDPRLVLMAAGAMVQAAADLTYLANGIGTTFADAEPPFVLFIAGASLLATAAYISDHRPPVHEQAPRAVHAVVAAAPYGVALALVVATLLSLPDSGFSAATRLLTAASIGVGTLVVFRQGLAIRENRVHVDKKRSELVASVSHELRTPLTAVVGVLALMSDTVSRPSGDELDELVSLAHREANRMSRIVADVTLLTRMEPAEMALVEELTSIAELVHETVETVDDGDSVIMVQIDPTLVATIDRVRVQQVLVNLIENGGRYGEAQVDVLAMEHQGALVFEVHDDGPGVPRSDRHVIWERFERGAHRFDATVPGSGIGLAVVAAIVAAHGGTSAYRDSERLGGACFRVELPGRCLARRPMRAVNEVPARARSSAKTAGPHDPDRVPLAPASRRG